MIDYTVAVRDDMMGVNQAWGEVGEGKGDREGGATKRGGG